METGSMKVYRLKSSVPSPQCLKNPKSNQDILTGELQYETHRNIQMKITLCIQVNVYLRSTSFLYEFWIYLIKI